MTTPNSLESLLTQATADTNGGVQFSKLRPTTTCGIAAMLQRYQGTNAQFEEIRTQGPLEPVIVRGYLAIEESGHCYAYLHGQGLVVHGGRDECQALLLPS